MRNETVASQINQTIEDIWMMLEKKERTYTNWNLNNQQYVLLTLIIRHPASTPTELADKMEISKSAVSQQLAKLEKVGLIIRERHTSDKRTFSIELAEKGRHYKQEMEAFNQQITEKYQESLSPAELSRMLSELQKLRNILS